MERARSAFQARLAAVMDSLLAAAVCEIAQIFESSLCEQQAELVRRAGEVSILRGQLEKAGRRPRAAAPGLNVGEEAPGEGEGEGFGGQSLAGPKEEVTGHDGAPVRHECEGSRPDLSPVAVRTAEGRVAAGDQRHKDAQTKISQWDQGSRSADHRPLQGQNPGPFLSISQSGRCSPRADPSSAQPAEWLPGLEDLPAGATGCPGPAGTSGGTDAPPFRPAFGPKGTGSDGDDSSFRFPDRPSENQHSDQSSARGQGVGERDARRDQAQAATVESPWRLQDDSRAGAGPTRRGPPLGLRDCPRSPAPAPRQPDGGSGRPYTCPYCAKCFTYPSHQRRHLLRHTGIRLHPCQFCDKSFLTPSELTVHTRTHTGERPFGCAQCGKRFARSGNLTAHQRDVHMRKRPFACAECGKRFANRRNLRVHSHRVHKGEPYYMDDQPEPDGGPDAI